jgi:hypothetical protein
MPVSEFMDRFYASMESYIWDAPHDPRAMIEQHPGWEVDAERLGIYGEFVPLYQRTCLEALFGRTRRVLEPGWRAIVDRYYATRPNHGYEINHLGHGFPDYLRSHEDLPPSAAEVALFELTVHQVYVTNTEIPAEVATLELNPTLQTLEFSHRVCAWVLREGELSCSQRDEPSQGPERGQELVLVWRHPQTLFANYRVATPPNLLALKIAIEGIDPAQAAEEGGVEEADVRAALAAEVTRGLLLAPPTA